jgi:hypothetical protein
MVSSSVLVRLFIAGGLVGLVACGPKVNPGDVDAGDDQAPCEPGASEACYSGAPGTAGMGPCVEGTRTCSAGGTWGSCDGEVVPNAEVCGNSIDDNCNGTADEDVDLDADGFTTCGGDCCDSANDGCASPELVNPGAFEAAGNLLDDDCDGNIDNVVAATCDTGLVSNSSNPIEYAAAMDLCQTATETPGDLRWGVIDAAFLRADGTGAPNANQRSIRPAFGGTTVQAGAAFAVLSTGHAAAMGQTAPAYKNFQTGGGTGGSSGFPADWLAANGGDIPNSPGCPPPDQTAANDAVMLQLRVRTPTNAKSFSFSLNFMSSEYPEWTCSAFNDFFVVLLDSGFAGTPPNPTDKNLAIYTAPSTMRYPVGVNLAHGNTGLFTQCENGPTGCTAVSTDGTINTCTGTGELAGTGMDQANPPANPQAGLEVGYCGANNLLGGGTGWLVTSGNVNGGEIITLRIALWDTSDDIYDSIAIVDNFEWSVEASDPGTVIE